MLNHDRLHAHSAKVRRKLARAAGPSTRPPGWRSAVPGVVFAATLAVLLRVPFVGRPAFPDEAGFLLVAQRWHSGGSALYGDLWLDRPPLLMLFWRAADLLGGVEAARWLGCLLVVAVVVASGWSGWLIGARRGAHWAAFTASALISTPLLATHAINGELLAAPFVVISCALSLTVVRRPFPAPARAVIALLAGAVGVGAVLVKQNFVDGLVFAVVLVTVAAARRELAWPKAGRILGWGALGALVPVFCTAWWVVSSGHGLDEFWYALYGFRSDAMQVIASQSLTAPTERLWRLVGVGLISGVLVLSLRYFAKARRLFRSDTSLSAAIVAMLALGYLAMLAGGSYWLHYLIGLVPALALVSGHLALRTPDRPFSRAALAVVVASAVVTPVAGVAGGVLAADTTERTVKDYLRGARHGGDSAVVAYGHANVVEEAGLEPGYRYLWSLPMRVLDPDLSLLTSTPSGADGPTWFVRWEPLDSWDIDSDGRLRATVDRHYREVAAVCEVRIYLRHDVSRESPEPSAPASCTD